MSRNAVIGPLRPRTSSVAERFAGDVVFDQAGGGRLTRIVPGAALCCSRAARCVQSPTAV